MDIWLIISRLFLLLSLVVLIKYEHNLLKQAGKRGIKYIGLATYGLALGIMLLSVGNYADIVIVCELGVIITAISMIFYVRKISRITKRFNHLANIDPLTGLVNRRYLYNKLTQDAKYTNDASVLFIDIDDFKRINDNLGHINADKVLCEVADEIQTSLRGTDVLCRFGGDEFIIILPKTNKDTALSILVRLQENVAKLKLPENIEVNFSAGVATYPEDGTSFEELLYVADEELFKVKDHKTAFN
ncbi:MAG: GGDEF domain-containing protein [Syntrophomonadaceae bacterium]|nr:GGDEF domain-containing protein [Syntrophomonadaceae bacterium]